MDISTKFDGKAVETLLSWVKNAKGSAANYGPPSIRLASVSRSNDRECRSDGQYSCMHGEGRAKALAVIQSWYESGDHSSNLCITGGSGSGKTHLVFQFAHANKAWFARDPIYVIGKGDAVNLSRCKLNLVGRAILALDYANEYADLINDENGFFRRQHRKGRVRFILVGHHVNMLPTLHKSFGRDSVVVDLSSIEYGLTEPEVIKMIESDLCRTKIELNDERKKKAVEFGKLIAEKFGKMGADGKVRVTRAVLPMLASRQIRNKAGFPAFANLPDGEQDLELFVRECWESKFTAGQAEERFKGFAKVNNDSARNVISLIAKVLTLTAKIRGSICFNNELKVYGMTGSVVGEEDAFLTGLVLELRKGVKLKKTMTYGCLTSKGLFYEKSMRTQKGKRKEKPYAVVFPEYDIVSAWIYRNLNVEEECIANRLDEYYTSNFLDEFKNLVQMSEREFAV